MKFDYQLKAKDILGHSPRGGCGLKLYNGQFYTTKDESLSARRVWIEIISTGKTGMPLVSLSARRVWIEMSMHTKQNTPHLVTLREEGVD